MCKTCQNGSICRLKCSDTTYATETEMLFWRNFRHFRHFRCSQWRRFQIETTTVSFRLLFIDLFQLVRRQDPPVCFLSRTAEPCTIIVHPRETAVLSGARWTRSTTADGATATWTPAHQPLAPRQVLGAHHPPAQMVRSFTLQWRHNGRDGVSNHQLHHCLLNRLSSASLAFVRGIHRWPVNSTHKWSVTRKMFPFHDVIMKHRTLFTKWPPFCADGNFKCLFVSIGSDNGLTPNMRQAII